MKGILIVTLALGVTACNDDDPTPDNPITQDIMEIVDATDNVATLKTAIDAAGLRSTLQGDGPFTVFAPTDDAFAALEMANPGITAYLLENTEELTKVLTYHVVAAEAKSTDLVDGPLGTVNGQNVEIDLSSGVMVNDASVTAADVLATNGVIHLINKVLIPDNLVMPEPQPTQAIMEIVDATASVSTLKAAIDAASLRATLDGDGPFTVFAPSDEAFATFSTANPGVLEFLLANPAELAKVLTYHVVAGKVLASDLTDGNVATVNGEEVTVDLTSGVKINDATVTGADIMATNGVIHLIDKVLVPTNINVPANLNPDGTEMTIVDLAVATPELSLLVQALTKYPDLIELLSDPNGTFTVFAPTNAAFEALLPAIQQTSLDDITEEVLKNVLQYHVISGSEVFSTDLAAGDVAAANGENITISANGDSFQIQGQDINTADADASNGVVHLVDGVLVPPTEVPFVGNVLTYVYFNDDFTTLVAAVAASDPNLIPTLQSTAGLTLFAPTNDAFEAAGITALPAEPALSDVLKYHVLGSVVKAADLNTTAPATPEAITTFGGSDFYLSNQGGDAGVFINGSTQVIATDKVASNGAVTHVINRTLVPPSMTIAGIASAEGFSRLVDALTEAGLAQTFLDPGAYTVFAPTNDAFDALYTTLGVSTTDPNPEKQVDVALGAGTLEAVLKYHVIGARVFSTDLSDGLAATTLQGGTVTVNVDGGVTLTDAEPGNDDAEVTLTDVFATNGVIHAIDAVILPVDLAGIPNN